MITLILLGTYNGNGNTYLASQCLAKNLAGDSEIVDLNALNITEYDYGANYPEDDFMTVVDKMVAADNLVFATPIYWFTMSTTTKKFFDRCTDLVTLQDCKPFGRKLAGKNAFVLSTGADPLLCDGFEDPFKQTFKYFAIEYSGCEYAHMPKYGELNETESGKIAEFAQQMEQ